MKVGEELRGLPPFLLRIVSRRGFKCARGACMDAWVLSIRPLSVALVALDYPWLARTHDDQPGKLPAPSLPRRERGVSDGSGHPLVNVPKRHREGWAI